MSLFRCVVIECVEMFVLSNPMSDGAEIEKTITKLISDKHLKYSSTIDLLLDTNTGHVKKNKERKKYLICVESSRDRFSIVLKLFITFITRVFVAV